MFSLFSATVMMVWNIFQLPSATTTTLSFLFFSSELYNAFFWPIIEEYVVASEGIVDGAWSVWRLSSTDSYDLKRWNKGKLYIPPFKDSFEYRIALEFQLCGVHLGERRDRSSYSHILIEIWRSQLATSKPIWTRNCQQQLVVAAKLAKIAAGKQPLPPPPPPGNLSPELLQLQGLPDPPNTVPILQGNSNFFFYWGTFFFQENFMVIVNVFFFFWGTLFLRKLYLKNFNI